MRSRIIKNMEWFILISALLLSVVGFVALYSATQSNDFDELKKQIMWFGVSIVIMVVIMIVDYDVWAKLSPVFYRSVYNIISSSIIYKGKKWSKQLV